MFEKGYKFLIFIFTTSIIISFFLPWVSVYTRPAGKVAKILVLTDEASFRKITGFKAPILANSDNARVIVNIVKVFKPSMQDVEKRIWFLWFVPILAWLIFLFANRFARSKLLNFIFAIIGGTIFFVAFYEIQTADLGNVILKLNVEVGLWFTLWAYLGIGILGFLRFRNLSLKSKKW